MLNKEYTMEDFKLRKVTRVFPVLAAILLLSTVFFLYQEIRLVRSDFDKSVKHVESHLAQIDSRPHVQDNLQSEIQIPIQEDASALYEDLSVMAASVGRYDLAKRYLKGVDPEKAEKINQHLQLLATQKSEIQGMILNVLTKDLKKESSPVSGSMFKSLISIEDIEDAASNDVLMTRNVLVVAYLSTELGFSGWDDIRSQLARYATLVGEAAPDVAEVCQKISDYPIKAQVIDE